MEKSLDQITRREWIAFRWVEIPPVMGDDDERVFRTAGKRTPDEAYQALEEWEVTAEDRDAVEDEPEPEKGLVQ
jgi:hypothetical protein